MNVRGQSILTGVGMIRYLSDIMSDHLRIGVIEPNKRDPLNHRGFLRTSLN